MKELEVAISKMKVRKAGGSSLSPSDRLLALLEYIALVSQGERSPQSPV